MLKAIKTYVSRSAKPSEHSLTASWSSMQLSYASSDYIHILFPAEVANHSGFLSIPEELLIEILSCLSLHDLTSCRRVNRALNSIIDNSTLLQHQVEKAIAGVMDNPYSNLSLIDRRAALSRRQEAWDTCKPQYAIAKKVYESRWGVPDLIQSSIYFRVPPNADSLDYVLYHPAPQPNETFSGTWYSLGCKRERHHKIIKLAVCLEENDLVAVGIQ